MQNPHGTGCEIKLEEDEELVQGKGSLKGEVNIEFYGLDFLDRAV